jgi:hypothetical protein
MNTPTAPAAPPRPDPAFPVVAMPLVSHGTFNALGLSRRAWLAGHVAAALAGAVAGGATAFDVREIVRTALQVADALLEALDA